PDIGCTPSTVNLFWYQALITAWEAGDAATTSTLVKRLYDSKVQITAKPPGDNVPWFVSLLVSWLPFIALIESRLDVIALNGPTDYRRDRLGQVDTWLVPNGPEATRILSGDFFRLTDFPVEDRAHVPSEDLIVQGRTLHVPKALKGVAAFSFKRLCAEARGPADYIAIAR
ncbi:AFG1/ZapE family ATPase, partial [Pseudomonas sp. EA_65y_Pfl1_P113]|uniref:AFG1/ZapE family ATPase n=1 Tax=Pseudomonas sp. EA_65y_Pfl1_P113 TaxID=3088692 RepID=UPI0030DDA37E